MKKKIFTLLALFAGVLGASAANEVTVSEALIPTGKSASFDIELSNPGDAFCAFQMDLKLPEGITFVSAEKSARFTAQSLGNAAQGGNVIRFTSVDTEGNDNYLGESGALFTVTVKDESGKAVGTKLAAQLLNMEFTRKDESAFKPDAVDFNIEITDRVILDETSTELPNKESNANVLVKRSISADNWNTICLPFEMSETQLKSAFGDDVKLAELSGVDAEYDESDKCTAITISFSSATALAANHPYIIKVTSAVSEFTVDNVTIAANEEGAYVEIDNGKTGSRRVVFGTYYGTLKAGQNVPKKNLFLSGNKFYYSTGSTTIKGFRGYFDIPDILSDFDTSAPAINIDIDGQTTKVDGLNVTYNDDQYYNLNGMKVENPTKKGVYIKNGKKVVIK